MAEKAAWDKGVEEAIKVTDAFIVVKHAAYWHKNQQPNTGPISEPSKLTQSQETELANDLTNLLDVVWRIEMKVVRELYRGPEHTGKFTHLAVQLDSTSDLGAWACLDKKTIQIAPSLI